MVTRIVVQGFAHEFIEHLDSCLPSARHQGALAHAKDHEATRHRDRQYYEGRRICDDDLVTADLAQANEGNNFELFERTSNTDPLKLGPGRSGKMGLWRRSSCRAYLANQPLMSTTAAYDLLCELVRVIDRNC